MSGPEVKKKFQKPQLISALEANSSTTWKHIFHCIIYSFLSHYAAISFMLLCVCTNIFDRQTFYYCIRDMYLYREM